jgi:hypothetical protein
MGEFHCTNKHIEICFRSSPVKTSSRARPWRRHLTAILRALRTDDAREAQRRYTRVQLSDGVRISGRRHKMAISKWSILFPNTRPDLPFGLTAMSKRNKEGRIRTI